VPSEQILFVMERRVSAGHNPVITLRHGRILSESESSRLPGSACIFLGHAAFPCWTVELTTVRILSPLLSGPAWRLVPILSCARYARNIVHAELSRQRRPMPCEEGCRYLRRLIQRDDRLRFDGMPVDHSLVVFQRRSDVSLDHPWRPVRSKTLRGHPNPAI
jgi:hypothetical protein